MSVAGLRRVRPLDDGAAAAAEVGQRGQQHDVLAPLLGDEHEAARPDAHTLGVLEAREHELLHKRGERRGGAALRGRRGGHLVLPQLRRVVHRHEDADQARPAVAKSYVSVLG